MQKKKIVVQHFRLDRFFEAARTKFQVASRMLLCTR